ncbi:MAG TPA: hypothetical protein VFQ92_10675 [Blastocatellia bacterium]|nr:hypothetical protein [Blastocatellia bacterium]
MRLEPGTEMLIRAQQNRLIGLRLVPLQTKRFRLNRAGAGDAAWLGDLLYRLGEPFGTQVQVEGDSWTLRGL